MDLDDGGLGLEVFLSRAANLLFPEGLGVGVRLLGASVILLIATSASSPSTSGRTSYANRRRPTMTVSSRSPTRLSRSLPSWTAFCSSLISSLSRRISASASSRPTMARLSAASAVRRSSCFDCMATLRLLNWLILSCTELSRPSLRSADTKDSRHWLTRSGVAACRGPPPAGLPGRLEVTSIWQNGR